MKEHLRDLVDVAYETIDTNYRHLSDTGYLSKRYARRLTGMIDVSEAIIQRYQESVAAGKISLRAAKRSAAEKIRKLRFDGGTGYIWINDTTLPYPRMVMHPTVPALNGKVLDSPKYNNALGRRKNLFSAFVEVTENQSEGYVDYLWPKPTASGLTTEVPKLSYVRRIGEWNWILGTGIYLDDAEEDIRNQIKETIRGMRYANGAGYFWINDDALPFPKMIMHPTVPALDGKVLDSPKYNNALGQDKNLFQAFVEITQIQGHGFVDYMWPKPTADGLTEKQPKISFVRLHGPLGWIIGSGAYIDYIEDIVAKRKTEIDAHVGGLIVKSLLLGGLFTVLSVVISFLFAETLARPIRKLTLVSEEISKGKNLDQSIDEVDRADEIGDLAKSVDRLKASVKIMLRRMTRN